MAGNHYHCRYHHFPAAHHLDFNLNKEQYAREIFSNQPGRHGTPRLGPTRFCLHQWRCYVDHPGFAAASSAAYWKAGAIVSVSFPSPTGTVPNRSSNWDAAAGCLDYGSNLDSMLNEKTAAKKFRSHDSYSPGGEAGRRPERATIVYANRMREAYKTCPSSSAALKQPAPFCPLRLLVQ